MNKLLITGVNGLLGQALIHTLQKKYKILATSVEEQPVLPRRNWEYQRLDITSVSACKKIINDFAPDAILNAASYTHVDDCEKRKELCWQINVKGVENLANLARRYDIHLLHYSTDYVFDGRKGPYSESDRPSAVGYYGKSKLASENVLHQIGCPYSILRTCVLYGTGKNVKKNFFLWVWENLQAGLQMNIVVDQFNNPTLAEDLALGSAKIIDQGVVGIYHMAGEEYMNRLDFATSIAGFFEFDTQLIKPVETRQLKQLAPRPLRGGLKIDLAKEKIGYQPRSVRETFDYLKWKIANHGEDG